MIYPPKAAPARIEPGATVTLAAGVMVGSTGVCQWSNATRVAVLLRLLGGEVAVQVRREDVAATEEVYFR